MTTMKKIRMMILTATIIIAAIFAFPFLVNAASKCEYRGCSNRTTQGSFYCSIHTCHHGRCTAKVISGSRFCSSHTCGKGRRGCYNEVSSANEKCSRCKNKIDSVYYSSSYNYGSSSGNKHSSYSSHKNSNSSNYEKPDCDDYEDYDDFMDDWDGCMPDGSDAEDYWESW